MLTYKVWRIAVSFMLLLSLLCLQVIQSKQAFAADDMEILTVHSQADTWVQGGSKSGDNFGSSEKMKVKRTSSENRDAFVKFQVPDVSEEIQSVTFSVYVVSMESKTIEYGGIYNIEVRAMDDTDWVESELTYDTVPSDETDQALGEITVTQADIGQYLSLDVTDYVKEHTGELISFRLRGVDQSRGADYATREHEDGVAPKLDIVLGEAVSEPEPEPEPEPVPDKYVEQDAIEDTYTRSGQGPFGDATRMNVKSNSSLSDVRRAFVKFELPQVDGLLQQAEVRLYVDALEGKTPDDGYDVTLFGIEDDSWDEMTLTDETLPEDEGIALGEVRVNADTVGTYIQFDVTSFVNNQKDEYVSFYLQSSAGVSRGAYYRTKEHSDNTPPQLALSYQDFEKPSIPQNVIGVGESKQVLLSWDASDFANIYEIERSTEASGPFEKIAEVTTTSYVDTDVVNDTSYFYRIRGINDSYVGDYSDVISVMPHYPLVLTPTFTNLRGETIEKLAEAGYVNAHLEIENLTEQSYDIAVHVQMQHETVLTEQDVALFAEVRKTIDANDAIVIETGFNIPSGAEDDVLLISIIDVSSAEQEELYHSCIYLADE